MRARIRRCEREYPLAERIAWRLVHDAGPFQPARVDNISQSGIALCVPGATQVSHGSAICTLSRRNGSSRRARVVRVEQTRKDDVLETVIGCHWISPHDRTRGINHPRPLLRAAATRARLEAARIEAARSPEPCFEDGHPSHVRLGVAHAPRICLDVSDLPRSPKEPPACNG